MAQLNRVMRKSAICICENKGSDHLRGNRAADQCLCFHYIDSAISLLAKSLAISLGCTALFVLDQVGNPEDRFSHDAAQLCFCIMYMKNDIFDNLYFYFELSKQHSDMIL